jgi:hypothetical protein
LGCSSSISIGWAPLPLAALPPRAAPQRAAPPRAAPPGTPEAPPPTPRAPRDTSGPGETQIAPKHDVVLYPAPQLTASHVVPPVLLPALLLSRVLRILCSTASAYPLCSAQVRGHF